MGLGYAYTNARVKGMKTNLLDDATVTELTRVKTVDEVIALLQQTPYKPELVEASKEFEGVSVIDEALHRNLAKTVRKLWKIIPKKDRRAFELFTAEWDAQNFKKIISKKQLGAADGGTGGVTRGLENGAGVALDEKELNIVFPDREPLLEKMMGAANALEATRFLASKWGSPKFRKTVDRMVETATASGGEFDFRRVIREIEKERVRQLALVSKTGDALTRKTMTDILEFQSVMLALRLKREGESLSGEDAEELGVKEFVFESKTAKRIGEAKNYSEAVREALELYGVKKDSKDAGGGSAGLGGANDASELAEKPLSQLEIKLERGLVEKILKNTRMSVLSFAAVIGFLYLKIVEVGNLRKIAFATSFGFRDEMKDFVYAINP